MVVSPPLPQRRKLTIECGGPSSKKHSFVTENSKIAQYLLSLCSAQHKFHSEMTSRQLNYSIAQGTGLLEHKVRQEGTHAQTDTNTHTFVYSL